MVHSYYLNSRLYFNFTNFPIKYLFFRPRIQFRILFNFHFSLFPSGLCQFLHLFIFFMTREFLVLLARRFVDCSSSSSTPEFPFSHKTGTICFCKEAKFSSGSKLSESAWNVYDITGSVSLCYIVKVLSTITLLFSPLPVQYSSVNKSIGFVWINLLGVKVLISSS